MSLSLFFSCKVLSRRRRSIFAWHKSLSLLNRLAFALFQWEYLLSWREHMSMCCMSFLSVLFLALCLLISHCLFLSFVCCRMMSRSYCRCSTPWAICMLILARCFSHKQRARDRQHLMEKGERGNWSSIEHEISLWWWCKEEKDGDAHALRPNQTASRSKGEKKERERKRGESKRW